MLAKNSKAPNFTSKLHTGEDFELSKVDSKYIVLYFYPKDSTSGCTTQACGIRDNYSQLKKFGAKIFGIGKGNLRSHIKFAQNNNLNFPLIVDDKLEISKLYDVLREKSMYGKKYMGIERTTYILDQGLKIIEVMEKVNPSTHVNDLIKRLEEMKS